MKTQLSKSNTTASRNGVKGRAWHRASFSIFHFPFSIALVLLVCSTIETKAAATNDITSLVQRGLFEEEANHNLDAATQSYESAIKLHDKDRKLAATATFRLGE